MRIIFIRKELHCYFLFEREINFNPKFKNTELAPSFGGF